jgi:acetyl-CoA decarbonylase/synthase complex subunit delta
MAYQAPVEKYNGKIREVTIGKKNAVTVGGESTLPFHLFEGEMPRRPLIAMEVYDMKPENWPEAVVKPFVGVMDSPAAWAKKCEKEYKADIICLQLASTDPNAKDASPEAAVETVKAVLGAISVPLIVYGSGNVEKDVLVLKKVAEATDGSNIVIGPVKEDNYKPVTAAAIGFKQLVAGETPIDVNMAKQLNILMTNLGLEADRILVDPSTGALGYGLEYTYSVMERDRLAALQQSDSMMQMPIICNLGKEAWKSKEAKVSEKEEPSWGDAEKRGILWEAITAVSLLMAGADVLIMRHPESVRLVRNTIDRLMEA